MFFVSNTRSMLDETPGHEALGRAAACAPSPRGTTLSVSSNMFLVFEPRNMFYGPTVAPRNDKTVNK